MHLYVIITELVNWDSGGRTANYRFHTPDLIGMPEIERLGKPRDEGVMQRVPQSHDASL